MPSSPVPPLEPPASLTLASPVGWLTVFADPQALVALDWGRGEETGAPPPLLAEAQRQLHAYFDGGLQRFDLPMDPAGSEFQRRVWFALADIPYGATETYGAVATRLGSANARAVGTALGRNPLPILLPCHRVVASGGRPGGYSGAGGLETKQRLLVLEGAVDEDLFSRQG